MKTIDIDESGGDDYVVTNKHREEDPREWLYEHAGCYEEAMELAEKMREAKSA
jgi:hypothetical protein